MDYSVVILAGGKGKRMKSEVLKPLIPLRGKRMIEYVVETFKFAGINDIIVVSHPLGKEEISNIPGVTKVIVQNEALGTFHALSLAISEVKTKYVFVTPADKPLLSSIDVKKVMNLDDQVIYGYESDKPKAVLVLDSTSGLGSVIEDKEIIPRIGRIAEDPDDIKANLQEKYRTGGVYCFRTAYIAALECDKHVTRINKNNEYYLTDVIPLLITKPLLYEIEKKTVANINTPEELEGISCLFSSNAEEKKEELEQVAHARLNLMGRHIDHQGGFTNVILLNQSIKATIRPRTDLYDRHILISKYGTCYYEPEVDELSKNSLVYLEAPIKYLIEKGYKISPCSITVEGNIPEGAGLSSSSAIIVATMKALIKFNNIKISDSDLVRFCGEAERLVGTNGGFGDQAAMILGTNNYITKMTTDKDIKVYETVKLPENLGIIVINSGEIAKKAFESKKAYNSKVESFKIGLKAIQEHVQPSSPNLTEVTQEMLEKLVKTGNITDEVRKVMQYGLNEIKRAEKFVSVLQEADKNLTDLSDIASLIRDSQDDERTLYGCSTPKIDAMIENINKIEGVLGSQICGAGLGGSIMVFYDKTYDKTGDNTINTLIKYSYDVVSFI